MKKLYWVGAGAFALLLAVTSVSIKPAPEPQSQASAQAKANLRLASVTPGARQDVNYQQLDQRLRRLIKEPAMVGLAVGVVENGRITFLQGYGETLAGSAEAVTPATVFRWASVSKGVAATMVAKLAEEGRVNLNAPVVNYASSLKLPANAEYRATVADLLSHRLGLYRNAYDNKLEEGQPTRLLRQTLSQLNLICPPGTCWSYQNVAYDGATEIVETAANKPFEAAVRESLFYPLGMTSASMSREALMSSPSWARPHSAGKKPLDVNDTYYRVPSAGGVNSNIKDLALWMIAQMGGMPEVVSPRVLNTIHASVVKTPGENRRMRKFLERVRDPHYGYGWRTYDYAGNRIVGHHGGVSGYRALIMFDPARKSGVVALWNSNSSQPSGIEFEVMDMIYGLPFRDWLELESRPARPAPAPAEQQDAEEAASSVAETKEKERPSRG